MSLGQQVVKPQQRGVGQQKHLEGRVVAINNVWRAGAERLNAACVLVTQQRTTESPLCGLILCISSAPRPASGATKSVCISAELRRPTGHRDQTQPEKSSTLRGAAEPHKITLVHKAAILNSLTGLYQEANKRDSKCDTVHLV